MTDPLCKCVVNTFHGGADTSLCEIHGPKAVPTTPRVARSVDDLRVGMLLLSRNVNDPWMAGQSVWMFTDQSLNPTVTDWSDMEFVILADPPVPPAADWLVPADTMEALSRMVGLMDVNKAYTDLRYNSKIVAAARAVIDAATEVER